LSSISSCTTRAETRQNTRQSVDKLPFETYQLQLSKVFTGGNICVVTSHDFGVSRFWKLASQLENEITNKQTNKEMTLSNKWKLENILPGYHISRSLNSDKHQTQIKSLPEEHVSRLLAPEHKRTNKQTNEQTNERTNKQTNKEEEKKKCTILR